MFVFWIIAKSAVFPIIVVSKNKRYPEFIQIPEKKSGKKSNMAARTVAASLSPDRTVFSCFLSCKSQCFCTSSSSLPVFKRAYSREFLLDVGRTTFLELNSTHAEELRDLGLLRRPTPSPTPITASRPQRRHYKRRERKQKRGKRGGIRARLAANPHKPAIPTIVLANVRSLDNKLDYI